MNDEVPEWEKLVKEWHGAEVKTKKCDMYHAACEKCPCIEFLKVYPEWSQNENVGGTCPILTETFSEHCGDSMDSCGDLEGEGTAEELHTEHNCKAAKYAEC